MNDRFTEFEVEYDLSDVTALEDSTPVSSFNKSFADISKLKKFTDYPDYMTFEHNYSVLDGTKPEFEDDPDNVAFFNTVKSNFITGDYDTPPTISLNFTERHSSFALMLYFVGDNSPLTARITWYEEDLVIYRNVFEITPYKGAYIIRRPVQNYTHIDIEFLSSVPDRYVKLWYIRYGCIMLWDELNVKSAKLLQENDLISDKISINKLNYEIVDVDDDTDPSNPTGIHNYFQRTQIMYGYEICGENRLPLGRYFLDKYSYKNNLCKISATDHAGLWDTIQFSTGRFYNGITAGDLLDEIFAVAKVEKYEIDEVTAEQLLYGTLPPMSVRKALREVLFACQSVLDTTDEENIIIYKTSEAMSDTITRGQKFSTEVTKTKYISGVEVKYSSYELSMQEEEQESLDENDNPVTETVLVPVRSEVSKSNYQAGIHLITFGDPHTNYELSDGTIISSGLYFIEFELDEEGEVIITAEMYTKLTESIRVDRPYIEAGEGENVVSFSSYLCNAKTAKQVAEKILDYYSMRLEAKVQWETTNNNMDNKHLVENPKSGLNNIIGYYTSRNIDLSGGFIDTAKFIGYFDLSNYYYYGRRQQEQVELYTDENEVI